MQNIWNYSEERIPQQIKQKGRTVQYLTTFLQGMQNVNEALSIKNNYTTLHQTQKP